MELDDVNAIVEELDNDGNQEINYTEFLMATIEPSTFLTEKRLLMLFKQFDMDNKPLISCQNLKDAFLKHGKQISKEEVKEMMKKHDISGDKLISY